MDHTPVYLAPPQSFHSLTRMNDFVDTVMRVGDFKSKTTNTITRNIVVLFDHLDSERDKMRGYSMFTMSSDSTEREKVANFIRFVLKEHNAEDKYVFRRLRCARGEMIDMASEGDPIQPPSAYSMTSFKQQDIDDLRSIAEGLFNCNEITPIAIIAHIDNPDTSYPHIHFLYISNSEVYGLYNVIDDILQKKHGDSYDNDLF